MRLHDDNTVVELRIAGYQYPNHDTGDDLTDAASWDSNWLVVAGSVRTSDGTSWSFQDPSLTTWEVARLADWLQQVADAAMTETASFDAVSAPGSSEADVDGQVGEWLTFTEPNLSFAIGRRSESQLELLIELSHEAAAPPLDPCSPEGVRITIVASRQHIRHAAVALRDQLITFPAR